MLLELILLGLVAYLLLAWHRKEVEKGGEGLGAAGPILEELEGVVFKIIDIFKKQANSTSKRGSAINPPMLADEAPTQKTNSPRIAQVEKFESVRQPREKSRSKHHTRHRSKMDSALKAAQK
ncbi:Protein CBG18350 [Caenorhabditis briggsae]|uniref:Uncharacterized protein n=2 Tax=Caenorhabditis briggsae TaxID=6238 RepID=A0AAE9INM3_CAEBR|nr:Protein CBG18350 [Caenorhabditis briggsae]ULT99938.1 hypothetical protein L3Y34_000896 [Caenorhabditis briggsae]CAP35823.1 Protein CBG18350 [Caenorhabditis briggsae]